MTTMDVPGATQLIGTKVLGPSGQGADETKSEVRWWRVVGAVEVRLVPESEGGFSAYVPCLRGVISEGDTEDEVLAMIGEAFCGAIAAYREMGEKPPFRVPAPRRAPEEVRWLTLNA